MTNAKDPDAQNSIEEEIVNLLEFILQSIQIESDRSQMELEKLTKSSKDLIENKLKELGIKSQKILDTIDSKVNDMIKENEQKFEENRVRLEKQFKETSSSFAEDRRRFNTASINRMNNLEKQIKSLSKGSDQTPIEMKEVAKDLKQIWDDNYGQNEEMKERMDKVDKQINGILTEMKKTPPKSQGDDKLVLEMIEANSKMIKKNFDDNSIALKLIEGKLRQTPSNGSFSAGVSPSSSLLVASDGFLDLSPDDPPTVTVTKKMYNLEVKFLAETLAAKKNAKTYYIKFDNDLQTNSAKAERLVSNLKQNFDRRLTDLINQIGKNKIIADNQNTYTTECITKFSERSNELSKSLGKYRQKSDGIFKHYIRDYKKNNMQPMEFKCED